ncbi:MAG: hypothetical protein J6A69_04535 [Clostridia bacterium]|nr:hypothetical protein [Clostridia bacterium]
MKKLFTLLLAIILLSGTCYAEEGNADLQMLEEYNIFTGDENGYRLEDNITKGEFVKMLAVASMYVDITQQNGFSTNGDSDEKAYNDLTEQDWEYPYFMFMDVLGMGVTQDNTTNAKSYLTYTECFKYAVKALGYEVSDNSIQNTMRATELGITRDLAVQINDNCTRENAVKIISNTLSIPVCALKSYDVESGRKEYTVLDGKEGREYRTLKTNLEKLNN